MKFLNVFFVLTLIFKFSFGQVGTPDFVSRQAYLFDPPVGIGAWNVWHLNAGSYGANVRIVDVEKRWNVDHEDLHAHINDSANFYLQFAPANPILSL